MKPDTFWSAPAERSGDGALDVLFEGFVDKSKAVSRLRLHRTPN